MKQIRFVTQTILLLIFSLLTTGCATGFQTVPPTIPPEAKPTADNRQTQAERPLWTASEPDPAAPNTAMETDLYAAAAPEFPDDLVWLNSEQYPPVYLADLRGQVVVLMFWSYECIDCLYNFQDLRRLHAEYPDDLVIISIHSAKLESAADLARVEQTIANYEAHFPTIDDQDQRLWYKWGAQGIPTFVVIDPVGAIYGIHNGADVYGTFKPILRLFARPQAD